MSTTSFPTGDGPPSGGSGTVTSVTGTVPITVGGTATDPIVGIDPASGAAAGSMSAADFTKLAGIEAGATNTPISASAPQPVGTATAGATGSASDAGHVHALPGIGTAGTYLAPSMVTVDAEGRATSIIPGLAALNDYGDESDGDLTLSTSLVLASNKNYRDVIIQSGGILSVKNYQVTARSITVQSGGLVHCNGNDASGFTGGSVVAAAFFQVSIAGASGGLTVGSNSSSTTNTIGGAGGNGGAGSLGAGGTCGALTAPTNYDRSALFWRTGRTFTGASANPTNVVPGQGGSGGGGDGVNRGGGGGGGAGWVGLTAQSIAVDAGGSITATGGAGAAGTAIDCGGGGGGGGGVVSLVSPSITVAGTVSVAGGGAGASGGGSGVAGAGGSVGTIKLLTVP